MAEDQIEEVPSGLVSCFLGEKEVAVWALGTGQLVLRLDEAFSKQQQVPKLYFHRFHENRYEEVVVSDYQLLEEKQEAFSYRLTLKIKDRAYTENVKRTIAEYSKYAVFKNQGQENEFSEEMVGYPAEKDYDFYEFYSDQKRDWMFELEDQAADMKELEDVQIAVCLNDEALYKQYLALDIKTFMTCYKQENHISHLPLFQRPVTRLYIGNEYCHLLFPKDELLFEMMDKAIKEDLKLTLCFTYMSEGSINQMQALFDKLYRWCSIHHEKVEIVINDWGMLVLMKEKQDWLKPVLGVLLNKRIKDPRLIYKKGFEEGKAQLAENSLNSQEFADFLKGCGVKRYEYETCGYQMAIAEGKHSLHLPFYVTNVSQYCPLYAMCTRLDRGHQVFVKKCPQYCSDYVFSYPKHLKMVGRFNSLFAFDDSLLKDGKWLRHYLHCGIDRLVINMI